MALIKCYKVKLKDLVSISEKAYKATAYDGSSCILPKSQVIRPADSDNDWFISVWIMDQKDIQHSKSKVALIDSNTMVIKPIVIIEKHIPKTITTIDTKANDSLIR